MRTSVNDMNLVTGLQGGDMSALETLMERHAARTYRLALAITRDHADAEEVIQDVFLNVFRKIATFEGRAAFGTWIYRITANLALRKRRTNRPSREEPDAPDRADPSPTPEELLLARETREIMGRLVDGLPASYRAVVVLRDFKGLSTGEAAHARPSVAAPAAGCIPGEHRSRTGQGRPSIGMKCESCDVRDSR
jgi:RNA polymerase sigma-70 factor, ECF subfamily